MHTFLYACMCKYTHGGINVYAYNHKCHPWRQTYMNVCNACIHICTRICTHTCINTYVDVGSDMAVLLASLRADVYAYIHPLMHIQITSIYTHSYTRTNVHTDVHYDTHLCMHAFDHMYIHIRTDQDIHAQLQDMSQQFSNCIPKRKIDSRTQLYIHSHPHA